MTEIRFTYALIDIIYKYRALENVFRSNFSSESKASSCHAMSISKAIFRLNLSLVVLVARIQIYGRSTGTSSGQLGG